MRRYCARGLATSALFIATIGCHDSLVKPLPVSAAMAQTGTVGTVIASTPEIVATDEHLAGQMVAGDTVSLSSSQTVLTAMSCLFQKRILRNLLLATQPRLM